MGNIKPPHLVPVDCLKACGHVLLLLSSFLPFSFQPWRALQITPFLLVGDHSPNPSFSSIAEKLLSVAIFFLTDETIKKLKQCSSWFGFIAIYCNTLLGSNQCLQWTRRVSRDLVGFESGAGLHSPSKVSATGPWSVSSDSSFILRSPPSARASWTERSWTATSWEQSEQVVKSVLFCYNGQFF